MERPTTPITADGGVKDLWVAVDRLESAMLSAVVDVDKTLSQLRVRLELSLRRFSLPSLVD